MSLSRSRKDRAQQKLGMERIERLFGQAREDFAEHPERSHRNVQLARKIAMRYGLRIPVRLKRKFCSKCYKYLYPNINCTVRKRRGLLTVRCMGCGNVARISEKNKKVVGR